MANRRATIVIGAVVAVGSALVVACGAATMIVFGTGSSLSTGPHHVASATTAMVARVDDIDGADGFNAAFGRPELRLSAAPSDEDVFIGVGPARAVEAYLAGADIDTVTDFELDPFRLDIDHRSGDARPSAPATQTFWVAQSVGPSPSIDWKVRDGNYRIVVMNADGSPGVAIDSRFTVVIPHLYRIAWTALIAGLVGLALGLTLVIVGVRKPGRPQPGRVAAEADYQTVA